MADETTDRHMQYNLVLTMPFDPQAIGAHSPEELIAAEKERISWLSEFSDVFADKFLFHEAEEFFDEDGGCWCNVLSYVEARNEFRAMNMPERIPAGPDDRRYAAEFFDLADPEHASWDEIHAVFRRRMFYKYLLESMN